MGLFEDQFLNILSQQQAGIALQNCQPGYSQRELAQAQQQACQQQLVNVTNVYGWGNIQTYGIQQAVPTFYPPRSVFVPLTQDEVDMAEAMYEVNKIAPGLKEEIV